MMELLSPAGSPEAVIAAVQNGADAVYLGFGDFNARRSAHNFTPDEFEKAIRYCRLRNCKVYVTLNTLVNDREMTAAVNAARMASEKGADAILVQDFGLAKVLRRTVPDIPLHASTQMSIHNLAGAEAAAQLGMTHIVLARELSLEEIRFISKHCSAETEVFVHGALCFCHSGQCYMSAMIGRRSGNRGMCAQPCRMQYSLGGRMDDYPLSLKDNCLANRLQALEEAGVACVKIEGRMKRPEYTGIVTGVYSKLLKEKRNPTPDEMELLARTFSRQGFTQGYLDGDKSDMFGIKAEPDEEIDSLYADARKAYSTGEVRRVPIHFYSLVEKGERAKAIAFDDDGNRAAAFGPVPERAKRQGVTANYIIEQMYKTGGTPFTVVENQAKADEGLFLPAAEINELRRKLISELSEKRMTPPQRRSFAMPVAPEDRGRRGEPEAIFQITTAEQLTPELAALKPHFLYAPAAVMAENYSSVLPFLTGGTTPVAVLPRVITDDETEEIFSTLEKLHEYRVNQALIGNIGHVALAKQAGMEVRGDFGLNAFNSQTLDVLRAAGFLSATASFELRIQQIRDMQKPLDTEMIIYGRLPVMVSDQCIIRQSSGRCNCQVPGQLADRTGSVFPVMKEFGCRNVIYNAHKLFLADRRDELLSAGLWGMRLLFTTESARECVEVAKAYLGMTDYQPNMLTRGLYYRGVE
ncbi:MAG: U32 family peptidase [Oscillospiraceae bacterium]|nr:U32 family peptidase [Oscillospiraceae bacterium]